MKDEAQKWRMSQAFWALSKHGYKMPEALISYLSAKNGTNDITSRKVTKKTSTSASTTSCTVTLGIYVTMYTNTQDGQCASTSQEEYLSGITTAIVENLPNELYNYYQEPYTVMANPAGSGIIIYGNSDVVSVIASSNGANIQQMISSILSNYYNYCIVNGPFLNYMLANGTNCSTNGGGGGNGVGGGPNPVLDANGVENVLVEEDESEDNYSDYDLTNGTGTVAIKYSYEAQIARDQDTYNILSVVIDPMTATPMTVTYNDNSGRVVTRSLTLFDKLQWYELLTDPRRVNLHWGCLVNARYVYSDGTVNTRQWSKSKTITK